MSKLDWYGRFRIYFETAKMSRKGRPILGVVDVVRAALNRCQSLEIEVQGIFYKMPDRRIASGVEVGPSRGN